MGIFKACDVRGVYPDEIDEGAAYRIGRAVGTVTDGANVVVGGDVRVSTAVLKSAVIRGLVESGCFVTDIEIVPTPTLYFAKGMLRAQAGVMVTASHNPPDHNGLKIALGDLPITEGELAEIRRITESREFGAGEGHTQTADVTPDYERHVIELVGPRPVGLEKLPRVVLDCGNGCFSEIAPRVFTSLGIPYVPLFCEIDGTFPNRSPNSAIPENLGTLQAAVVRERADLGVAFDGDGDRVSFVDESGSVLSPDQTIAIMARYSGILEGEKVVLDQKCSAAVSDVLREIGAAPLVEKSGHTFIKTRMIRENAAFGGEISGHLFYRELGGGDDGLYSAIVMAGIVACHGPLSKLAGQVPRYATTPDIRIRADIGQGALDRIAAAFPQDRVSRLDGVRVQFEDGWALARMSVTEPVITLRLEGRNERALREIVRRFLEPAPEILRAARDDEALSALLG